MVSAYMEKTSGSTDRLLNVPQSDPQPTSKTPDGAYASATDYSIPQTTPNVNAGALKLVSAYGKENAQGLLNSSEILYLNPDKERTDQWLRDNRLQLPFSPTTYGSIGSISQSADGVNGDLSLKGQSWGEGQETTSQDKEARVTKSQPADPLIADIRAKGQGQADAGVMPTPTTTMPSTQTAVETQKTATDGVAAKPGEYRLNKPQNVDIPTVPIINLSVEGYAVNKATMNHIIHACSPPSADRQAVFAAWREARAKAEQRMMAPPKKISFERKLFQPYLDKLGSDKELERLFLEFLRERVV